MESVAPCWEDVVLQRCGTVVGVDDMARLQKYEMENFLLELSKKEHFTYIHKEKNEEKVKTL